MLNPDSEVADYNRRGGIMNDGWSSPSVIVAGIAALISAITGVIAWLGYRAGARADWPVAKLTVQNERSNPRYVECRLVLENPSASTWTDIAVEIRKPRHAIYADMAAARSVISRTDNDIKTFDPAFDSIAGDRAIEIAGTLHAWGSTAGSMFRSGHISTDEMQRSILIIRSSIADARDLSIRVTLKSNDAKPRKHVIFMKRNIPPAS